MIVTKRRVVRAGVKVGLNGGLGVGSTVGPRVPWEMRCPATHHGERARTFWFACGAAYSGSVEAGGGGYSGLPKSLPLGLIKALDA